MYKSYFKLKENSEIIFNVSNHDYEKDNNINILIFDKYLICEGKTTKK